MFDLGDHVMPVGADPAGRLLEFGIAGGEDLEFIVPATPVRQKFLR